MSTKIFADIESFEFRRLNIGGDDDEITDDFMRNLALKWILPIDSGDTFLHPFFSDLPEEVVGIDEDDPILSFSDYESNVIFITVANKPWILTVEEIEDVEHLIMYSFDPELTEGFEFEGFALNPDITIDGDNFIKQLDGGEIADAGSGLEWAHLFDEGTSTLATPIVPIPLFAPMLFFKREDIS